MISDSKSTSFLSFDTKNTTIASPVNSSGIEIEAASEIFLCEITACSISAVLIL